MLTRFMQTVSGGAAAHPTNCYNTITNFGNGNIYANNRLNISAGSLFVAGGYGVSICKMDPANTTSISMAKYCSFTTGSAGSASVCISPNSNLVLAGEYTGAISGVTVQVLNSTGTTVQWGKIIHSTAWGYGSQVCVDTSNNVFLSYLDANGYTNIVKYNSSGTQQWTAVIQNAGRPDMATDSSDNLIVFTQSTYPEIFKFNSSGTLVWKRIITTTDFTNNYTDRAALVVNSTQISLLGRKNNTDMGVGSGVLYRITNDGTGSLSGEVNMTVSGISLDIRDITENTSNGDLYTLSQNSNSGESIINKFSSTGTHIWCRKLLATGYKGIRYDSNTDHLFVSNSGKLMKIKADGTGLGTYGAEVYSAPSITIAPVYTSSISASSTTVTTVSPTLTTISVSTYDYTPVVTRYYQTA